MREIIPRLSVSCGAVNTILDTKLHLRKLAAKLVPHKLLLEQKVYVYILQETCWTVLCRVDPKVCRVSSEKWDLGTVLRHRQQLQTSPLVQEIGILRPVTTTQCPVTTTQCPVTTTRCPVSTTQCPVTTTQRSHHNPVGQSPITTSSVQSPPPSV